MKKRNITKKLILNKRTMANLGQDQMTGIHGGQRREEDSYHGPDCYSLVGVTCDGTCEYGLCSLPICPN